MFGNIIAIIILAISGLFITSLNALAFLNLNVLDVYESPGFSLREKMIAMGILVIFAIIPLVLGLAFRGFRQWKRDAGVVLLYSCGWTALIALSIATLYFSAVYRRYYIDFSSFFCDYWAGSIFYAIVLVLGILLAIMGSLNGMSINLKRTLIIVLSMTFVATMGNVITHYLSAAESGAGSMRQDPCEYFFRSLMVVPNERLTRNTGEHVSIYGGEEYFGCEVKFVTHDLLIRNINKLPDFRAEEGTGLYREGWRMNNSYDADGPGGSSYGIEKGKTLCLISVDQPAYVDDDGKIVGSETLTIIVQCRDTQPERQ